MFSFVVPFQHQLFWERGRFYVRKVFERPILLVIRECCIGFIFGVGVVDIWLLMKILVGSFRVFGVRRID